VHLDNNPYDLISHSKKTTLIYRKSIIRTRFQAMDRDIYDVETAISADIGIN